MSSPNSSSISIQKIIEDALPYKINEMDKQNQKSEEIKESN